MAVQGSIEAKQDVENVENTGTSHQGDTLLKSSHDDLGVWATAWRFKKAWASGTLTCMLLAN